MNLWLFMTFGHLEHCSACSITLLAILGITVFSHMVPKSLGFFFNFTEILCSLLSGIGEFCIKIVCRYLVTVHFIYFVIM